MEWRHSLASSHSVSVSFTGLTAFILALSTIFHYNPNLDTLINFIYFTGVNSCLLLSPRSLYPIKISCLNSGPLFSTSLCTYHKHLKFNLLLSKPLPPGYYLSNEHAWEKISSVVLVEKFNWRSLLMKCLWLPGFCIFLCHVLPRWTFLLFYMLLFHSLFHRSCYSSIFQTGTVNR